MDNFLRVHPRRPVVLRKALPNFGLVTSLNRGCYPVQWDRNWSRGLVLHVLAREKLERKYFLFKLTNECWKMFHENYGES